MPGSPRHASQRPASRVWVAENATHAEAPGTLLEQQSPSAPARGDSIRFARNLRRNLTPSTLARRGSGERDLEGVQPGGK